MGKIIVIVGPTASGKTKLSIAIAKKFNCECINSDATQIFQGTDIATNKITNQEMENVVHHMLSIKKIDENYSVGDFQKDARKIIDEILNKNKNVVIVGGTGLYTNALIMNYNFSSKSHIKDFEQKFIDLTNEQIHMLLKEIDPLEACKIHVHNRYRLIRALEIASLTNKNKSNLIKNNKKYFYNNLLIIGLKPNRKKLYERINNRVLELVDKGLFEEIKKAYEMVNKNKDAQSLKCIGGPEIIKYLNKEISKEQCIELMQKNNRHYARRQLTWFKNQLVDVNWFDHNFDDFDQVQENILKFIENNFK